MNILMLTPYLPYPLHSGGQIRTYNLLKKLSSRHDITLCALIKDESEAQFASNLEKFCNVKLFKRSAKPFTLHNIVKTGFSSYPFLVVRNHVVSLKKYLTEQLQTANNFDLIHAETFYMMPHLPITHVPILLAEQTIEYLGYESYAEKASPLIKPLLNIDIAKLKRWEQYYWNHCQQLIVMSDEDQAYVKKHVNNNTPIDVVANGVDTAWFDAMPRKESQDPSILFVGTFRWLPNVEAVNFLVKEVWPLVNNKMPKAKLKIVGAHPSKSILALQNSEGVEVIGNIPDIRTAFKSAHVLAAPVFSGKGTRYKILEALAAGTPVLATSTAVEGLHLEHGVHALVRNDAESFAQALIELLNNPTLRNTLRKNGRLFVKNQYDWPLISKKLDEVYYRMTNQ